MKNRFVNVTGNSDSQDNIGVISLGDFGGENIEKQVADRIQTKLKGVLDSHYCGDCIVKSIEVQSLHPIQATAKVYLNTECLDDEDDIEGGIQTIDFSETWIY